MDSRFYLPFANFSGVGPHKFHALVANFGSAKKAFYAKQNELEEIIGKTTAEKFIKFRKDFDIESYESLLEKKNIDYVCLSDENYPSLLKQIPNPPIVLFVKGEKALLNQTNKLENVGMIAIVGTRKITSYGQEVTDLFARELSENFVIVSGMAMGVDGVAHSSCLENGGKTIAVLGSGVDQAFPASNKFIYDKIVSGGGAVISELPPGEPPSIGSFPARNRIIAGISQAVLVTQGAFDSGSMITADFAKKFNRPVFAVPGPITSSLSKGPNSLIASGAKLVFQPADILGELGIKNHELRRGSPKFESLNNEEKKIVELLERENLSFDEIGKRLKLDASKLASILSMMEIKGILKTSEGVYLLNSS